MARLPSCWAGLCGCTGASCRMTPAFEKWLREHVTDAGRRAALAEAADGLVDMYNAERAELEDVLTISAWPAFARNRFLRAWQALRDAGRAAFRCRRGDGCATSDGRCRQPSRRRSCSRWRQPSRRPSCPRRKPRSPYRPWGTVPWGIRRPSRRAAAGIHRKGPRRREDERCVAGHRGPALRPHGRRHEAHAGLELRPVGCYQIQAVGDDPVPQSRPRPYPAADAGQP